MFKLDDDFLATIGLGALPAEQKPDMLRHIYETLELRVGMKLAEQMTDAQLDEFEGFIDRKDDAGALKWLESNFPHYKQVVAEELEKLKAEISSSAEQILAVANGQAPANPDELQAAA
jgi:predicted RNA-binding Zn ribbon-like protein